jgi:hypothetical protein
MEQNQKQIINSAQNAFGYEGRYLIDWLRILHGMV